MQKSLNLLREAAKKEDEKVELLYFDEAGVCNVPNVQRGWSPLGKPHRADASVGRKRVNVLGALNYAAQTLAFEVHEHSVCRQDVLNFLDKQARNSARDKLTVVVLDNASIHRHIDPKMLEEWMVRDRFILLFLPPYSPELNLIEILWKQAKYHWRSFATWAKQDLLQEVHTIFGGFGTEFTKPSSK
jgi:transposase